ncbi:MAG: hypothetical protein JG762_814 [Deferribacteraceae bacterium]|jgi:hypothetical protein|nr:hypothetical protein [Deferribacteraceae bacterium]
MKFMPLFLLTILVSFFGVYHDFSGSGDYLVQIKKYLLLLMFFIFLILPLKFNKFYRLGFESRYNLEMLSKLIYILFIFMLITSVLVRI